jgi:putative DNA methylase
LTRPDSVASEAMIQKRKLIEVALPLEAINVASAREKSIRHGHPSALHLWWARRPLAAARAVIFAQMVDDPSCHPDTFKTERAQEKERQRLFRVLEQLVIWENTTNERVLQQARDEIWQSWRYTCAENVGHPRAKDLFDRHKLPGFHDPFSGGGALPLEAQRLGMESYAGDLNPVAVLINKAMIEIPPRFAGEAPVNPSARAKKPLLAQQWTGADGLAEDVRYYGQWMRDEAEKRIGYLYPKIEVTSELALERSDLQSHLGERLTVIAWIWARTVRSPNPAFAQSEVPLISTFMLSAKSGKQVWLEPVVDGDSYRFVVRVGRPTDEESAKAGTKLSRGTFKCLLSGTPIEGEYLKAEGQAGRLGTRLIAIVAEGARGRIYLNATAESEAVARQANPAWRLEGDVPSRLTGGTCVPYGLVHWGDLFTSRQLVALTTFSDLVLEARDHVKRDAITAGRTDDGRSFDEGGTGADALADALAVYLAFQVDQLSNHLSSLCAWHVNNEQLKNTFARQSLPMTWDFAETNPFSSSTGSLLNLQDRQVKGIHSLAPYGIGVAAQEDATTQVTTQDKVVSTDPPYYDNIAYADLSDFFYVWLRRSLRPAFPALFSTLAVPKSEELVASAYRHGGSDKAEAFFLDGMTRAMRRLVVQAHPSFPVTIYYAFKQAESDSSDGLSSTGWETFLAAVIGAGFALTGTWPMRTEQTAAMKTGTNALASSIILVCRQRPLDAPTATRREFVTTLKEELPRALSLLQRGNIAPVDLAQAAIGPGMAIYTRYAKVLDAEGEQVSVREALALINQTRDEALAEQGGDLDADSRWALAWFEQFGFADGDYGVAETLSTATNTSVAGVVDAGLVVSGRSKVRLLKPAELPADWDPDADSRLGAWEIVHHLVRALEIGGGETAAAALVAKLGTKAEAARALAYRLYALCERKKRPAEAMSYNGLVLSWPEITRLAHGGDQSSGSQTAMFAESEE